MVNKQIYITSVSKAVSNAKIYGKFNTKIIQLFKLYKDLIDFSELAKSNGSEQFDDIIVYLKNESSKLLYKYPKELCNYKIIIPNDTIKTVPLNNNNTAPTVSDNTVNLLTNTTYQFKVSDFILNYSDSEYDNYKYLLIYPLSSSLYGNLKYVYNTLEVTTPIVLDIEGLSANTLIDLYYNRIDFTDFGPDNFNFRISDNNINYLYSSIHTIGVSGSVSGNNNLPPSDIGDITLYTGNRTTTVLTLDMFTTSLTTAYNDPEGDLIDAIRIVDVSNANQGIYYYNGVPIVGGEIITREDINAGLFTHSGPDIDSVSSDVFEFEARDEGSGIWVG